MEGRPRTNPEQDRVGCSHKVGVVVNVKRLKSDIYLSLSVWHSTSITNFSSRELIE